MISNNLIVNSRGMNTDSLGNFQTPMESYAIYLDCGASNYSVNHNAIKQVFSACYFQSAANDSFVNNFVFDAEDIQFRFGEWCSEVPHGNSLKNNILYYYTSASFPE